MKSPPEEFDGKQACLLLLLLLLGGDCIYLVIHIAWLQLPGISLDLYSLYRDRSYAEFFQYMKYCWGAGVLGYFSLRYRSISCIGWAILFGYMLLDDSMWLHEWAGGLISASLNIPQIGGMPGASLGEVVYAVCALAVLSLPLVAGWLWDDHYWRGMHRHLFIMLLVLAMFSLGVDVIGEIYLILHIPLVTIIEDLGEMYSVSVMVWIAVRYSIGLPIIQTGGKHSGSDTGG